MPVDINTATALAKIAIIDAAAARAITKMVYVTEVGGTGAASGATANQNWNNWMNPQPLFPTFAEGGYAAGPQLAIVGDVPGGEWMIPDSKMQDLMNGVLGAGVSSGGNLPISTDLSGASGEVEAWSKALESRPVKVKVQADLIINSDTVRELIIEAIAEAVKEVRR